MMAEAVSYYLRTTTPSSSCFATAAPRRTLLQAGQTRRAADEEGGQARVRLGVYCVAEVSESERQAGEGGERHWRVHGCGRRAQGDVVAGRIVTSVHTTQSPTVRQPAASSSWRLSCHTARLSWGGLSLFAYEIEDVEGQVPRLHHV